MKKRQLKLLDQDTLEDIDKAMNEERKITFKIKDSMAKKKPIFKKDYTLTDKQKNLVRIILDKENKVTVITGPPGTAKTFSASYAALKLYDSSEVQKIYLTKPIVQAGTNLGYLPGTKDEKVEPYMESFISTFETILDSNSLTSIMSANDIEFKIPQFMRGVNYKDMIMIVDEFQNFSIKELMTIITRLNKGCKIVFCGDTNQNDIDKKYVAVNFFKKILQNVEGVNFFEFEKSDILRDPILIKIIDNYEKYQSEAPESKNNA